jgi:hypothetical protein
MLVFEIDVDGFSCPCWRNVHTIQKHCNVALTLPLTNLHYIVGMWFVFSLPNRCSHTLICTTDISPGVPGLRPCGGMCWYLLQNVKLAVCFYVKVAASSMTLCARRDAFRECGIKINFIAGFFPTVKCVTTFNRRYSTGKWRYSDFTSE